MELIIHKITIGSLVFNQITHKKHQQNRLQTESLDYRENLVNMQRDLIDLKEGFQEMREIARENFRERDGRFDENGRELSVSESFLEEQMEYEDRFDELCDMIKSYRIECGKEGRLRDSGLKRVEQLEREAREANEMFLGKELDIVF